MKAVGIVVEYNPFHNGHAYHLEKTKEVTNADIVIAVMSGQFLQRGEPALLPKWSRAHMALLGGVDIVIELPYQFATQQADIFASGAIDILGAMGCSSVCFGSESGNIDYFLSTLDFLENHNEIYQQKIKYYVDQGMSYPSALSSAFLDLQPTTAIIDLSKPNNILGFQYVKAIRDLGLSIKPFTISRSQADYHDQHFTSKSIASATSIRKSLFSRGGTLSNIEPYVPSATAGILFEFHKQYGQFHQWENYWSYLRYRILQSSPAELSRIYEVEEGLENRVFRAALKTKSFQEFMEQIKTKRYTWTRLQRMCTHILTNTTYEEMDKRMKKAAYLRLLGMSQNGRMYLNEWKEQASLPLISKLSSYNEEEIALDIRASRIYALGAKEDRRQELLDMDYNQPPIMIKNRMRRPT